MNEKRVYIFFRKACFFTRLILIILFDFSLSLTASSQSISKPGHTQIKPGFNSSNQLGIAGFIFSLKKKPAAYITTSDTLLLPNINSDSVSTQQWTDRRSLYLCDQAEKKSLSGFPSFPESYLNLSGLTAVGKDNVIQLFWQVDINENIKWFFIERSADRKIFYKTGEIDLIDKTNQKVFCFKDTATLSKPVYYYQVKALLVDGSSMMSDIIPVKNGAVAFEAFLNVGTEKDTWIVSANQQVKKIEIMDTDGRIVYKNKNINLPAIIDIMQYANGPYAVRVFGENGFVTQLFIKK